MEINKHFVRWYDGKSTIKERKECDRWQLTCDMTEEEMVECKKDEYGFLKKVKEVDPIAALKVLKITKILKLLIYVVNEKQVQ